MKKTKINTNSLLIFGLIFEVKFLNLQSCIEKQIIFN